MRSPSSPQHIDDIIEKIISLNTRMRDDWSKSKGWAPLQAAELLSRSRLDWQVSMSHSLKRWTAKPSIEEQDATQVLAYANLGALVEGTLKLFLSVYYETYKSDIHAILGKKNAIKDPDELMLGSLRQFFIKSVWSDQLEMDWDKWIEQIQERRNAIHAYKHREIGAHKEIGEDIRKYYQFLQLIDSKLPPGRPELDNYY